MNYQIPNDYEGKVEGFKNTKSFFIVIVEGSNTPPTKKHDKYIDAFNECMRLSKKENKKAYVLVAISEIEQIPNITQLEL